MEFNRILSLVIGAIVVILALVWIGGRLRDRVMGRAGNQTVTVTVTPTATPTPTPAQEATQRRNPWNPLNWFRGNPTPTPTPTRSIAQTPDGSVQMLRVTPTPTPAGTAMNDTGQTKGGQPSNPDYHSYSNQPGSQQVNKIPNTGSPTLLIPVVLSSLFGGIILSRTKKQ